jgi:hypothetical protein
MMEGKNIATLTDLKGENNIEVEINKGNEASEVVEMKVKDEEGNWIKSVVSIRELYGMIFMLVGPKEQQELLPVRKTEVRVYERQHKIKLSRDMRKGEIVIANCKMDIPLMVEEGLYGLVKRRAKTVSGILLPSKMGYK